jgi:hypothetical protein
MKKLLLIAILTFNPFFSFSNQSNKTELLAHLNKFKDDITWSIHDCDSCLIYTHINCCASQEELDILDCVTNVWTKLLKTLDPSKEKLTIVAQNLFQEIYQTQKNLRESINIINEDKCCVYMTIVRAICLADEYNKTNNPTINDCLNDPQLQKFICLKENEFFWKLGNAIYCKDLLIKLLSILDAEIDHLIVSIKIDELRDKNQKTPAYIIKKII